MKKYKTIVTLNLNIKKINTTSSDLRVKNGTKNAYKKKFLIAVIFVHYSDLFILIYI